MADQNLNQLIQSLKTEGIEAAEAEARTIIAEAQRQAQALEADALKRKNEILIAAEQEATDLVHKGQQALQQAARDLKLGLHQEIVSLFDQVFQAEVRQNFTPDLMRSVLLPLLENIGTAVNLEVPDEVLKELSEYLRANIQKGGDDIVLRPNGKGSATMHIRHNTAGWTYEISPATITEALRPHLTQRWLDQLEAS